MKKLFRSRIFLVLVTAIIVGGITVLAETQFQASEVGYKSTTVDKALDDLYDRVSGTKVACLLISGEKETVGSKYACNPGDGNIRYFYILKTNTTDVEMIMEKNLTDEVGNSTMDWNTAMAFFTTGAGKDIKTSWKNINDIDLPDAQTIADVTEMNNWNVNTATTWAHFGTGNQSDGSKRSNYSWLYNYTRGCRSNGDCSYEYGENDTAHAYSYWTSSLVYNNNSYAWFVGRNGGLYNDPISDGIHYGIRPVITISKSKISN